MKKPTTATAADQRAYNKAVSSNTFNSRSYSSAKDAKKAAATDFQKKYGTKYTAKYSSKPSSRPDHIPSSFYRSDGNRANVVYMVHNGVGGYYYRNSYDDWVMYNMMEDRYMRNRYMYRHGYDYSGQRYVRSGWSVWSVVTTIVLIIIFAAVVYAAIKVVREKAQAA